MPQDLRQVHARKIDWTLLPYQGNVQDGISNLTEDSFHMSQTKEPTVHHIVESKRWEQQREQERITYPSQQAIPIQMDWRTRENYSATDLDYRGRNKST